MESLQELNPEMTIADAAKAKDSKDPTDVEFWDGFQHMCQVKEGDAEPDYVNPKSDVSTCTGYALEVYRKVALVQETDLVRLTGASAKILKVTPLGFRLDGPKQPKTYLFPISLVGLPESEAQGLLKMKVTHQIHVEHAESVLRSEDQILQQQGANLWNVAASKWNENSRPMKLSASSVHNLQDLMERAKAAQVQAAASEESSKEEEGSDDGHLSNPRRGRGIKAFSVGTTESVSSKAKAKAKAPGKSGAGKGVQTAGTGKPAKQRAESPSQSGRGSKGRMTKSDKLIEEAESLLAQDEEMLRVARKALTTDKGSGIKCLKSMRTSFILESGVKPANCFTGVGVQTKNCDRWKKCTSLPFTSYQFSMLISHGL